MLDVFITHAWRFHPEWLRVSELIENNFADSIRNFSLPWHDPAISPNSDYGRNYLDLQLRAQISPAHIVLVISDLLKVESNCRWLQLELEIATGLNKNIVILGNHHHEILTMLDPDNSLLHVTETDLEAFLTNA